MKLSSLLGTLAVAGVVFTLTGCPGQSTTPAAPGTGPAPATTPAATKFDPNNKEHLFTIYAAHQAGDQDLLKTTCKKYGLYDGNGVPIMDQYQAYTGALTKFTSEKSEEWSKFITENQGKWKEYVQAHSK